MKHESQNNTAKLLVPSKVVAGLIVGIVVVLLSYIYSSYAHATTYVSSSINHTSESSEHWQLEDTHAHIIFYRAGEVSPSTDKKVLNVFVNNQYHTSMLPASRAIKLELCPGQKRIGISVSKLQQRSTDGVKNEVTSPALFAGKYYYYQISLDSQGKVNTRWVPEQEAEKALAGLKPQNRLLSRVLNEHYCPEITYSISSTALFAKQHSHATQLKSESSNTLAELVKAIGNQFQEVNKVVVKNYSEVSEDSTPEHPLSQMRANSVATWLVNSALPSPLFIAEGRDLKDCHAVTSRESDNQACLQYKRRVDVEVYGKKKPVNSPLSFEN